MLDNKFSLDFVYKTIKIIIVAAFIAASFPMLTPLLTAQDDGDDNQNHTLPPGINCDMADPIHYYCPMPPPNRTCNVYGDLPSAPTDLILRYPDC
jgi:hypothetical protein